MPFVFPSFDPETSGQVTQIPVPLEKYLSASFDAGYHDSAFNSVMRMTDPDMRDDSSELLDPKIANEKYGVGNLKFDQPIRETTAQAMSARKKAEMDREFYLFNGGSKGRFLPGMAASLIGATMNPLDLGLMFVPVVGEERLAAKIAEAGGGLIRRSLARGLITQEALAASKVPLPRLVGSVVQGTLGQAVFEIPNLVASSQDQSNYGLNNALMNVGIGGVFSAAIHTAGMTLEHLARPTKEAMIQQAINQFLKDEDIRVHEYVRIDENAIRERVKFNEDASRQRAIESINEADLKKAIYSQYHEEPKQAAIMVTDNNDNHQLFIGAFHGDAYGKIPADLQKKIDSGDAFWSDGFVTDTGRYVSRDEAARMMGIREHLTAEAMHGTTDESFLSEEEHDVFQHHLENGVDRTEAWNKTMAFRERQKQEFFFNREDVQDKLEEERIRQIDQFVANERANYNPEKEYSKAVEAEIAKQQSEGRILPPEVIQKYLDDGQVGEESVGSQIDKDIENLRKNLEKPEKEDGVTPEEQKFLDSMPKPEEKSINAAIDCLLKKTI